MDNNGQMLVVGARTTADRCLWRWESASKSKVKERNFKFSQKSQFSPLHGGDLLGKGTLGRTLYFRAAGQTARGTVLGALSTNVVN